MIWGEGGRGSRAHSPELVVACVLVITHVLVVTHILVVARVHSWVLAGIREPQWPFWLVIRVRRWRVVVHGQWAVVVVVVCVLPWTLGIICGRW